MRNAGTGQGVELEWDADVLPHCWIWHEVRTYGGAWREAAEILAIEPASVPHGLGLETAIREGQALFATPHAPRALADRGVAAAVGRSGQVAGAVTAKWPTS